MIFGQSLNAHRPTGQIMDWESTGRLRQEQGLKARVRLSTGRPLRTQTFCTRGELA
jgi:hypothetical protein